ncbi:MAG TPA: type II secretion system protein [Bryobacteraceae bacterium]|nr:type II secretion system protein [Bryobacteraceae bacterium]
MRRRRQSESGFALLMLMVAAAVIAVMLYREMPRVVFEGQRQKEELLIARGEQYYRAIQLFSRKMRTYPPTIEALENTNNTRFLRRRYKDPMTGKDDWRLIHAGPGGIFIDSLTRKAPQVKDATDARNMSGSRDAAEDPNAPAVASVKTRKRASDTEPYMSAGAAAQDPFAPAPEPSYSADTAGPDSAPQQAQPGAQGQTAYPFNPQTQPAQTAAAPQAGQPYPIPGQSVPTMGQPLIPGQAQPVPQDTNNAPAEQNLQQDPNAQQAETEPLQADTGQGETAQVQPQTGVPAQNQQVSVPQYGGSPTGGIGVSGGFAQTGVQTAPGGTLNQGGSSLVGPGRNTTPGMNLPTGGNNSALDSIQRQLMGPRLGATPGSGQMLGAGIAGVATKFKGESIRIYNEKTKYTEWEFLYDPRTDLTSTAGRAVPVQTGQQNPGETLTNRNTQ